MATIDWEQFNENFQYYDDETIQEVIENFFEESDERLAKLEKNIQELDFQNLSFNAHSLKSVIGNFMAPRPYELARKLEELGKQQSQDHIEEVFFELREFVRELISELKIYLKTK